MWLAGGCWGKPNEGRVCWFSHREDMMLHCSLQPQQCQKMIANRSFKPMGTFLGTVLSICARWQHLFPVQANLYVQSLTRSSILLLLLTNDIFSPTVSIFRPFLCSRKRDIWFSLLYAMTSSHSFIMTSSQLYAFFTDIYFSILYLFQMLCLSTYIFFALYFTSLKCNVSLRFA